MRKRTTAVALTIGLLVSTSGPAHARTWYVNVSGTGDAPTIEAALDSAVAGDTVLVGPGTYGETLSVPTSVIMKSELGPLRTLILGVGTGGIPSPPNAIFVSARATLEGFRVNRAHISTVSTGDGATIRNNIIEEGGGGENLFVNKNCVIENNLFLGSGGVRFSAIGFNMLFRNNIVFCSLHCESMPVAICNDFLETTSPCVQALLDPFLLNFSADPQFCGVEGSDNYYLQTDSPCAEGNTPDPGCGQVGPLPVGCSTVNTQERSWGEVKAMYRE